MDPSALVQLTNEIVIVKANARKATTMLKGLLGICGLLLTGMLILCAVGVMASMRLAAFTPIKLIEAIKPINLLTALTARTSEQTSEKTDQ